jgi:hypothetical protein
MACPDWEHKIIDFTMQELSPGEMQEVELHSKSCAECAKALDEFRNLHRVMNDFFEEREMPAHLVMVPEKSAGLSWSGLSSSWGAAALGGALAVIFIAGLFLGGLFGPAQSWFGSKHAGNAALTRAEIQGLVAQEVSARISQQSAALQAQDAKLAASLRQEREQRFAALGKHMEYLQSAQDAIWKEAQQQNAIVELIARNSLSGPKIPATRH